MILSADPRSYCLGNRSLSRGRPWLGQFFQKKKLTPSLTLNGPFAAGDHMVQKRPYWRANWALGHLRQSSKIFFVLYAPVCNLLSSMAVFVPCDRQLQRAHCWWKDVSSLLRVFFSKNRGCDDARKVFIFGGVLARTIESKHFSR